MRKFFGIRLCGLLLAGSILGLVGCAAPAERNNNQPNLQSAERVAGMLAGSYAGELLVTDESAPDSGELVRLEARVARIAIGGVEVTMTQRRSEDDARNFVLVFQPTAVATRLEGTFSPLDPQGRRLGSCPIEVSVQRDGFIARTDARSCRFGSGGDEVALVKEIAHDGERLIIGDRVVDPLTGESRVPDRVLELERVREYIGWAGVRDSGAAWRIADGFRIGSDGIGLDPEDAGGMSLGISLDLAPHRVREDEPPVLRLRVFDRDSGELLGQSWADPGGTRIGLALAGVQVGLTLTRSR